MQARAVEPRSCGSTGTSRQKSTGMPSSAQPSSKTRPRVAHAHGVLREEEHRHGVVALIRQDVPAALRLLAEEMVRHLEEDGPRRRPWCARAPFRRGARGLRAPRARRRGSGGCACRRCWRARRCRRRRARTPVYRGCAPVRGRGWCASCSGCCMYVLLSRAFLTYIGTGSGARRAARAEAPRRPFPPSRRRMPRPPPGERKAPTS